jgi:hypothetical protein
MANWEPNWAQVGEAILEEDDCAVYDMDLVVNAVSKSWDKYHKEDLEGERVLGGVEKRFEFDAPGLGARKQVGVVDLWFLVPENRYVIVDWKMVKTLDEKWVWREKHSDQGLFYARGLLATIAPGGKTQAEICLETRGISQRGDIQKRVWRVVTMEDLNAFDLQDGNWQTMHWLCHREIGYSDPWPRNKPQGCRPFGPNYPCEFEDICFGRSPQPEIPVDFPIVDNVSYSMVQEFKRCPERARLKVWQKNMLQREKSDGPHAELGKAFHRGIAECYRQALEEGK